MTNRAIASSLGQFLPITINSTNQDYNWRKIVLLQNQKISQNQPMIPSSRKETIQQYEMIVQILIISLLDYQATIKQKYRQESVFYNYLLDMILNILFCILVASAAITQLPIRIGISQLVVGARSKVSYSITFKNSLLTSGYNSLISVSYINDFNTNNGIDITSTCPTKTQVGMQCTLTSTINNQYSIVYMSYIVSDYGSLQVSSYSKTFNFGSSTEIDEILVFNSNVDKNFINTSNFLQVNIYPFIAGISSLDSDFSLKINGIPIFDSNTNDIAMNVTISEVHAKNITIVFGFIIYDCLKVSISLYQGQKLIPGSIQKGLIYGIKAIQRQNTPRLLQTSTLSASKRSDLAFPVSAIGTIDAIDAASIDPVIQTYPKNKTIQVFKSTQFTPQTPSYAAQLLRSGQISQLSFTGIWLNPAVFSMIAQNDSVIDVNSSSLQILKQLGLFSNKSSLIDIVRSRRAKHSHKSQNGIDSNLFNNLFATNGFVIMTSQNDMDQIYYYQVDELQTRAFPKSSSSNNLYMMSPVTNKKTGIVCLPGGKIVGIQTQIDYIQKKMMPKCVYCSPGTYVSYLTKKCAPNPKKLTTVPPKQPIVGGPIRGSTNG